MVLNSQSNFYITILDGYTDEPSCLGVPPYLAPLPRYVYGAIKFANKDFKINYVTIDEYRAGNDKKMRNNLKLKLKLDRLVKSKVLILIAGAIVPGKYLRSTPISDRETLEIAEYFDGIKIMGGAFVKYRTFSDLKPSNDLLLKQNLKQNLNQSYKKNFRQNLKDKFDFACNMDLDAAVFDYLSDNQPSNRIRTSQEWRKWSLKGTELVLQHPEFPTSLMIELEAGRGCVRFQTGGCSFCSEPHFGEPIFRDPGDILEEVSNLDKLGVKYYRLGAISCIFSYFADRIGESETPTPNPKMVSKLLRGIRSSAPTLKVLHLDNANPAVMAAHLSETKQILKIILETCTSGNVLSFGLESADPLVNKSNNLNTEPEEVFEMIKLVNNYGSTRGSSGMPRLLPGLNFVYGLQGESKETFKHNFEFLRSILDENLLLRRINLRQVLPISGSDNKRSKTKKHHRRFIKHKKEVREYIDRPMLSRICPPTVVLKNVFMELTKGNITFGRQLGSYPILVGVPYKLDQYQFHDVVITDHGFRSVTGFVTPFSINTASEHALQALPGIGAKRASRLLISRPFSELSEVHQALDDPDVLARFEEHLTLETP
jgi:radical SAM superfamily enzyme with C-terminal helix-hairpin-helix motif